MALRAWLLAVVVGLVACTRASHAMAGIGAFSTLSATSQVNPGPQAPAIRRSMHTSHYDGPGELKSEGTAWGVTVSALVPRGGDASFDAIMPASLAISVALRSYSPDCSPPPVPVDVEQHVLALLQSLVEECGVGSQWADTTPLPWASVLLQWSQLVPSLVPTPPPADFGDTSTSHQWLAGVTLQAPLTAADAACVAKAADGYLHADGDVDSTTGLPSSTSVDAWAHATSWISHAAEDSQEAPALIVRHDQVVPRPQDERHVGTRLSPVVSATIATHVSGAGLHRRAHHTITLAGLQEADMNRVAAVVGVALDRGMYVDVYELQNVERMGGARIVCSEAHIDVELPAELSSQHMVWLEPTCAVPELVDGALTATCLLEYPIHIRYQLAQACSNCSSWLTCGCYHDIPFLLPMVLMRGAEAWEPVPVVAATVSSDQAMRVPVAALQHARIVWWVTLLAVCAGSLVIVATAVQASRRLERKLHKM